jgi:preprotein translocase subunit SecG
MLFTFLLIVQTLVAASLVTVILMQRSEGGGLGVGGSTSGLMTARGAADFLTRATAVLAAMFVVLSIALAALATVQRAPSEIDASLARQGGPATPSGPLTGTPAAPITGGPPSPNNDPLAGAAEQAAGGLPPATTAPATPAPANGAAPKQ